MKFQAIDSKDDVIVAVIAENEQQARAEVERQLKGRPGGRHVAYQKWVRDGRSVRAAK